MREKKVDFGGIPAKKGKFRLEKPVLLPFAVVAGQRAEGLRQIVLCFLQRFLVERKNIGSSSTFFIQASSIIL
ncbi:hypothetical protein EFB08_16635 [Rufibacter latericius]|uniref:Uncharacterized protein n=1 Tax=Rufibacter latericius TaxID=2487040 RepID=A0A3M9MG59_9BACT|nr:hypothetical protein EFB08_16635 [Rufibacter latericius]